MRHVLPDPEQRRAPGRSGHADRHGATGTAPGTRASPAQRPAGPAPGHAHVPGPAAARVVRDGSAGTGADAHSHDLFDPDLPLDALDAAPLCGDRSSTPCPDDDPGVDSPVLRVALARVLTRWTVATCVCLCAGPDPAPADVGPTRRPGHRPGAGEAPDPHRPFPGIDGGDGGLAPGTAVVVAGNHDAAAGDPARMGSEVEPMPVRGAGDGGRTARRFGAHATGPAPRDPDAGVPSPPGRAPGCPASDAIARLRLLIARHLPRTTCPRPDHDCAGSRERSRDREPGAGSADTAEPGARLDGTVPPGTGRTRGRADGAGTGPADGSRPEPGTRTPSGSDPCRETRCRICLDRVEQAERSWRSLLLDRSPMCAGDAASRAETPGRTRDSHDVTGGGDRC